MNNQVININEIELANNKPFVLFGGMNVLESRDLASDAYCRALC